MADPVVEAAAQAPGFKEQAAAVLQQLITAATQVGDFVKGEIPKVIQELLVFHMVKAMVVVFIGLFIISTGIYFSKRIRKAVANTEVDGVQWIPFCAGWLIGLPITLVWLVEFFKIWLAPRVWLIEYAADLVSGAR